MVPQSSLHQCNLSLMPFTRYDHFASVDRSSHSFTLFLLRILPPSPFPISSIKSINMDELATHLRALPLMGDSKDEDQQQSKFLMLPGEIRNTIYRMCLLSDTKIKIPSMPVPEPAILSTCRQTRHESASIYYSENKFLIDFPNWDYVLYEKLFHYVNDILGETRLDKASARHRHLSKRKLNVPLHSLPGLG